VDTDCDVTSGCGYCHFGYCTNGSCLGWCLEDQDCLFKTQCPICVGNRCGAMCGTFCMSDEVCSLSGPDCPSCFLGSPNGVGVCRTGACFDYCQFDYNCQKRVNSTCTKCTFGQCTSDCGVKCSSDDECRGRETNCGSCANGTCQPGTCGTYCSNNLGCTGNCSFCNGDNCDIGLPCNSKCRDRFDCDQRGPCSLCSSHGFCALGKEKPHNHKVMINDSDNKAVKKSKH